MLDFNCLPKIGSFFFLLMYFLSPLKSQELPAYQLFNSEGEKINYAEILERIKDADVVFFGEFHGNPICHWLQRELLGDLFQMHGENLVMGGEFFEAHDQLILDEYLSGWISENNFKNEARFWNNYDKDYKPMVEFAKENGIPFIATNVPRRYANLVFREGMDGLNLLPTDEGKRYIAPLPFEVDLELRSSKMMLEMAHGDRAINFVYAQAIKDATMAHFIDQNLEGDQFFYHINGSFHSNYKEGIIWYLERLRPELKIVNIASVMSQNADEWKEDYAEMGDIILSINERLTNLKVGR